MIWQLSVVCCDVTFCIFWQMIDMFTVLSTLSCDRSRISDNSKLNRLWV